MEKKIIVLMIASLLSLNILNSLIIDNYDRSKGPLYGKTMYLPYFIYLNLPVLSAKGGEKYQFEHHFSVYLSNDILIDRIYFYQNEEIQVDIIRDYENVTVELGASYYILKNFQIGLDIRFLWFHGGFLDNIIQSFHYFFGFPNAGREFIQQDQVYIDIKNENNVTLFLDKPAFSFGDMDLWVKYNFFNNRWVSLAALGGIKIPTGRAGGISVAGSGFPDLGFGVLVDFRPFWVFTFYLNAGIVIPLDYALTNGVIKTYPMFNGMVGLEINPLKIFSINAQFNIKSSGLRSNQKEFKYDKKTALDYLELPQTNILVGCIFKYKGFKWQIYFEEDAITNAGVDLTLNFNFSHNINLKSGK